MLDLKVINREDNSIHNVWKYVNQEGQESIWCKMWYGHHIIGIDCEWYCAKDEIKITYSPARYDGPLPISKTTYVAKVEWINKTQEDETISNK